MKKKDFQTHPIYNSIWRPCSLMVLQSNLKWQSGLERGANYTIESG